MRHAPSLAAATLAGFLAIPAATPTAQPDIEVFAPAREATLALQAARRAGAAERAQRDLRLADLYFDDATAALRLSAAPADAEKAARLFRLAAAQARLAETRAVETMHKREAAGASSQLLEAIEGDPQRILPPRPSVPEAGAEYRQRQRDAARATEARRAAEETVERLRGITR